MDGGEVTIREARREDLPAVVALLADDPLAAGRETASEPLPPAYEKAFQEIEADPRPGYHFAGWGEEGWPDQAELTVELSGDAVLTARFEPVEGEVVINEIGYNPPDDADSGDWVELLNRSDRTVDLSGWRLVGGSGDGFALPEGTRLEKGEFLVVVEDEVRFRAVFPRTENAVGDFGFGLSLVTVSKNPAGRNPLGASSPNRCL